MKSFLSFTQIKIEGIKERVVFVVFVFYLVEEHFSIITKKEIGKKANQEIGLN